MLTGEFGEDALRQRVGVKSGTANLTFTAAGEKQGQVLRFLISKASPNGDQARAFLDCPFQTKRVQTVASLSIKKTGVRRRFFFAIEGTESCPPLESHREG